MNEEFYHHGIRGQKWGVRRFQNVDGSLTSAGKRRYDTGSTKSIISTQKTKSPKEILEERNKNSTERINKKVQKEIENKIDTSTKLSDKQKKVIKTTAKVGKAVGDTIKESTTMGEKRSFINPNQHKIPGPVLGGPKNPETPQERAERREKERIDRVRKETREKITSKMPYSKIIFDVGDVLLENGKKYIQG